LVDDLSEVIGATLKPVDGDVIYSAGLDDTMVEAAMSHEYEDDYGIRLSDFPIVMTVRDLASDRRREESTARKIFDKLRNTGSYQVCLVFDLRRLLAET
jgi:hypothetical protein